MKNWTIIISVFLIPLALYFALSTYMDAQKAQASPNRVATEFYVLKFSTPMCMDCKRIESQMKIVQDKYKHKVNFESYNAAENSPKVQNLIKTYKITVVPTTVFFNAKTKRTKVIEGYMDSKWIDREIRAILRG